MLPLFNTLAPHSIYRWGTKSQPLVFETRWKWRDSNPRITFLPADRSWNGLPYLLATLPEGEAVSGTRTHNPTLLIGQEFPN